MKKLIVVITLAVASFSSFGQGFFTFTGGVRGVWDTFTATPKLAADMNVGFLWGTTGSALVTTFMASIPTNSGPQAVGFNTTAWNAITTDPNYTVAFNSGTSAAVATPSGSNGAWSYNSGATFGVTGTSAQAYNIIVFGWSNAFATPALAAAANSPVGWAAPFSYTAVGSIGTPLSMPASGLTPFGVATAPVPEPATIALAGLGGLSLLALRRKK